MGNTPPTCKYVDENGVKCQRFCIRWGGSYIDFCGKHGGETLKNKVEALNLVLMHELQTKYGEKFVREITEMYSVTPIPQIRAEFEKIVKSNGLVDDGRIDEHQFSEVEGRTVFRNDMARLRRVLETPLIDI